MKVFVGRRGCGVDVEVLGCRVASLDGLIEGASSTDSAFKTPTRVPWRLEAVGVKRGDDAFQWPAEHVLLHQQPGEEPRGEASLQDRLRRNRGDQRASNRAVSLGPTVGRTTMDDPHDPFLPIDLLGGLLAEGRER